MHITPHDGQLPIASLATRYICKITSNFTIMVILKVLVYSSCLFILCSLIYTDGKMSIRPFHHITPGKVPPTPPTSPLVALSPQPLEAMSYDEESIPTTNVDQERQDDDLGRGCGRRFGRKHGRRQHERVSASPIEPMVGHHERPIRKRKTPLCGTY